MQSDCTTGQDNCTAVHCSYLGYTDLSRAELSDNADVAHAQTMLHMFAS